MVSAIERSNSIIDEIAKLAKLFGEYSGHYGSAPPTHESSGEQWAMSDKIYQQQVVIAKLLDHDAIKNSDAVLTKSHRKFKHFMNHQLLEMLLGRAVAMSIFAHQYDSGKPTFVPNMLPKTEFEISQMLDPAAYREATAEKEND